MRYGKASAKYGLSFSFIIGDTIRLGFLSGLVEYLIIIIIMASSKYEFVNCDNFTPVELIITTVTLMTPH